MTLTTLATVITLDDPNVKIKFLLGLILFVWLVGQGHGR